LARTARAGLVAADLALATHVGALRLRRRRWQSGPSARTRGAPGKTASRLRTGSRQSSERCTPWTDRRAIGGRKLELPDGKRGLYLGVLSLQGAHELLASLLLLALDLLLRADFDFRKHRHRVELHAAEHRLEQLEGLALVLEAVVLLRVPAQMNALAQVVHRSQVVAPVLIELLQHLVLLDEPPQCGIGALDLLVVSRMYRIDDSLTEGGLLELRFGGEPPLRVDPRIEVPGDRLGEPVEIPVGRCGRARHELIHEGADGLLTDAADRSRQIVRSHELGALLIDDLALVVRDVIEQQQLLADVEVVRFDFALRLLDLASEHAALEHLALLHA